MTSRSLNTANITCKLETDNNGTLSSDHFTEIKDIDNTLDEIFEILDKELNTNKINVCKVNFIISTSPPLFEVVDNFHKSCFSLKLNLPDKYSSDLVLFLNHHRQSIEKAIVDIMIANNRHSSKIYFQASFSMEKKNVDVENNVIKDFHVTTENNVYTREEISKNLIDNIIQRLMKAHEDVDRGIEGSGYVLRNFSKVMFNICKFERVGLNGYKPYPDTCRGKNFIYNPETRQN